MEGTKRNSRTVSRRLLFGATAGLAAAGTARGQQAAGYPSRSVLYINLFPPGAATDLLSRVYCTTMSDLTGQQFIVENRSGAGGTVGQNAIAQARQFHDSLGVTGIALTKLDGTAKGGVIIGICDELKLPVRYIGIGESVADLKAFEPKEFVEALFQ